MSVTCNSNRREGERGGRRHEELESKSERERETKTGEYLLDTFGDGTILLTSVNLSSYPVLLYDITCVSAYVCVGGGVGTTCFYILMKTKCPHKNLNQTDLPLVLPQKDFS